MTHALLHPMAGTTGTSRQPRQACSRMPPVSRQHGRPTTPRAKAAPLMNTTPPTKTRRRMRLTQEPTRNAHASESTQWTRPPPTPPSMMTWARQRRHRLRSRWTPLTPAAARRDAVGKPCIHAAHAACPAPERSGEGTSHATARAAMRSTQLHRRRHRRRHHLHRRRYQPRDPRTYRSNPTNDRPLCSPARPAPHKRNHRNPVPTAQTHDGAMQS